jgi:methanogenic corrinoid protein MtbC1
VRARWLIENAAAGGLAPRELYLEVLAQVLDEVGERWAAGDLNAATEHYATAVTQGVLAVLAPRMRRPPTTGRLAVVGCVPGEQHALGAQMIADFLEGDGWEVLSLGASVPSPDLAALVDAERPDAVCLSAATAQTLTGLSETLTRLGELDPRPFVVVGGHLSRVLEPGQLLGLGADATAQDPPELLALLNERFPPVPEEEAQ